MSAFLYFAQGRRTKIKNENPGMKNTEISRILGEMWRNASDDERRPHVEKEKVEREKYKVAAARWKEEFQARAEAEKKSQATPPQGINPCVPDVGQGSTNVAPDPSQQVPAQQSYAPAGDNSYGNLQQQPLPQTACAPYNVYGCSQFNPYRTSTFHFPLRGVANQDN